jgi:hypothetical protein
MAYERYDFPTVRPGTMGQGKYLLLNRNAAALLTQGGEREMAIIQDPTTGALSIRPLEIENCVAVVRVCGGSDTQPRLSFNHTSDMRMGKHYRCRWNDVDGQLDITTELAVAQGGK